MLVNAGKPGSENPLRWLDLSLTENTAPELKQPGRRGPDPGSRIEMRGDIAVVKAIVTTRSRKTPDKPDKRFRNLLVLDRHGSYWKVLAWQTTEMKELPTTADANSCCRTNAGPGFEADILVAYRWPMAAGKLYTATRC